LGLSTGHARSQVRKVRTTICRTFRTWPVASPMEWAHNQKTKPSPKGPTSNLSDLSDLAPCRPREEAQGLRTRLGPKGLENYLFRTFRTWTCPWALHRACKGPIPKGPTSYFSDASDLACCRPREEAHVLRTRPMSERSDRLSFLSFRIQPPGGPVKGPRTKGQGQVRRVRTVNFIDHSDIALSFGSGYGPLRGASKGPIPNGPEN